MALLVRIARFDAPQLAFTIDGVPATGYQGETLLAAILRHADFLRRHEVSGEERAGFCLMGACQDCWVQVGVHRRAHACTTLVEAGMQVVTAPDPAFLD